MVEMHYRERNLSELLKERPWTPFAYCKPTKPMPVSARMSVLGAVASEGKLDLLHQLLSISPYVHTGDCCVSDTSAVGLLEHVLKSRVANSKQSIECVQRVLDAFVAGRKKREHVLDALIDPFSREAQGQLIETEITDCFTTGLIEMLNQGFRKQAVQFLEDLGLLKAPPNVTEGLKEEFRLPQSGMYVKASKSREKHSRVFLYFPAVKRIVNMFRHSSKKRGIGNTAPIDDSDVWEGVLSPAYTGGTFQESGESEVDASMRENYDIVEARVVAFPNAAKCVINPGSSNSGEVSLLQALVNHSRTDADLFENLTARSIVTYKWLSYGRSVIMAQFLSYLLMLILLIALSFTYLREADFRETESNAAIAHAPSMIISIVIALLLVFRSVDLLYRIGAHGLQNVAAVSRWSYLTMIDTLFTLTTLIVFWLNVADDVVLLFFALLIYLKFFGLLYYLQAFEATGPFVRMVVRIVKDMRWFMLFMLLAVTATTMVFSILLSEEEKDGEHLHSNLLESFFTTIDMLFFGNYEVDDFSFGPNRVWIRFFFLITEFTTLIVLLNLLIALMSSSYEKVSENVISESYLMRAKLIISAEQLLSHEEKQEIETRWIHVLVPESKDSRNTGNTHGNFERVANDDAEELRVEIANLSSDVAKITRDLGYLTGLTEMLLAQSPPRPNTGSIRRSFENTLATHPEGLEV